MTYSINELAKLSNITTRALRFYDTKGLLKPAYIGDNGYRFYQKEQLLRLQQILFFKEMGFDLKHIQKTLTQSDFNQKEVLKGHKNIIVAKIKQLRGLLQTIDKTVEHLDGSSQLSDDEIFRGLNKIPQQAELQKKFIHNWTKHFGEEEGRKQLKEAVELSRHWTIEEFNAYLTKAQKIVDELARLQKEGVTPHSQEAQLVIKSHYKLLLEAQPVTKEFYLNMQNYICDPEQRKGFDVIQEGLAEYFAQGIQFFAEHNL